MSKKAKIKRKQPLQQGTERGFLSSLCSEAQAKDLDFALFRHPHSAAKELFVSERQGATASGVAIDQLSEVFLTLPFDGAGTEPLVMQAQLCARVETSSYTYRCPHKSKETYDWEGAIKQAEKASIEQKLNTPEQEAKQSDKKLKALMGTDKHMQQRAYEHLVSKAVAAIEEGALRKVVVSRREWLALADDLDLLTIFYRLCELYPSTFVYLLFSKSKGVWLGASPELLANCMGGCFETVALAGTRPMPSSGRQYDLRWRDKEIQEQAFVEQHINEQLKAAGFSELEVCRRETTRTADVAHLCTRFRAKSMAQGGALSQILSLLHPTPALCGTPQGRARNFIAKHEPMERELYGGCLGPVYEPGHYALYVNIRCGRLFKHAVRLHVGGGIVAGSKPYEEWIETEWKAKMLKRAIGHG